MHFTEAHFENAILELMHDKLGYDRIYGPDVERDYTEPLHLEIVRQSLFEINPSLATEAIDEAIVKIRNIENGSLVQRNEVFTDYMQNGVEVNFFDGKDQCSTRVRLIDYDTPLRNNFTVANQWTVEEKSVRRADIIVFVNGFPLVVVELKSPSRENTDVSEAYAQLRNYMQEIPSLFVYNAFCVMSDMSTSKVGTITAGEDRFMEWKTSDGTREDTRYANFDVLFAGMFYVRLDGAPKFAMWCEIIGAGLNILLDYVFIYPLNMGIMGAAIASSLSCLVGALLIMGYLIFFTKRIQLCSLRAAFGRSARWLQTTWQQVKLGLSGFLGEVAISLMLVLGNYVFGSLLGESGVAAYSIACYCSPLFFMINNAIAQSAQPIISYDYGARRWERVRHTLRLVLTVAIVCSVVMTTLIILLTDPLVSLFVKDDPTTHALAVKGMPLFAVDLLFLAVNVTMIGYFQSIKRGTWATVFTTLRGYIFLMFSFIILPLVWGVPGAWLAIPVAEGFTTVCIVLFIFSFRRNVVRTP